MIKYDLLSSNSLLGGVGELVTLRRSLASNHRLVLIVIVLALTLLVISGVAAFSLSRQLLLSCKLWVEGLTVVTLLQGQRFAFSPVQSTARAHVTTDDFFVHYLN